MLDEETLKECNCVAQQPCTKSKCVVINLLEELAVANEENEKIKGEVSSLKEENRMLMKEMKKEKEASAAWFDRILWLIHGDSTSSK